MLGFNATIIFYLQDQLKLSNSLVGIVYSIAGFGSLIAVTFLSTFLNKKDAFILMNISMATIPLVIMASGIVENWIFFWNLLFHFEWTNYNSFCLDYNNTATRKVLCIILERYFLVLL